MHSTAGALFGAARCMLVLCADAHNERHIARWRYADAHNARHMARWRYADAHNGGRGKTMVTIGGADE